MNKRVEDAKQELIDFIDMLNITNSNYDDILELVLNSDDAFFVKVIEEIKDGNLTFNDFKRTFSFSDVVDSSIEKQAKLYREHKLLSERLLEAEQLQLFDKLKYLVTIYQNKEGNNVIYSAEEIEKENKLISMLTTDSGDLLESLYKNKLLNDLLSASDAERSKLVDSMLFSLDDYLVPVDFNHIELTDMDLKFARENNMTDDEMKKMKSFSAYLSTFYE